MLRLNLNVISYVAFMWLALASFSANAQSNTCLIHDHNCIYHGIGRAAGVDPSQPNGINATANWDKENDFDLHSLLPQSESYSSPLEAINYPLQPTQPFFPTTDGSHIYPNHYSSTINDGGAIALHSGDDGGGVAIYPSQSGCINQTGIACENITVTGDEIPSGVYSYSLHAFSATGTEFESTNYNIDINSTGNIVLVMTEGDQTALTGVIQGAENQSETIDVFAINVGNSGHVGGVTLPQLPEITNLNEFTFSRVENQNLFTATYVPELIERNAFHNLQQDVARTVQISKLRKEVASKQAVLAVIEIPRYQTNILRKIAETNNSYNVISNPIKEINDKNFKASLSNLLPINENEVSNYNSTAVYIDHNSRSLSARVEEVIDAYAESLSGTEKLQFKWEATSFALGLTGIGQVPSVGIDIGLSLDSAWNGEFANAGFYAASTVPIVGELKFAKRYGKLAVSSIKAVLKNSNKSDEIITILQFYNSKIIAEFGKVNWEKVDILQRGLEWEDELEKAGIFAGRLPPNFKTFDFYDQITGSAISVKTIDLNRDSYINGGSALTNLLKMHIDKTADFTNHSLSGTHLKAGDIKSRVYSLAIPEASSIEALIVVKEIETYAMSRGIQFDVIISK